MMKNFIIFSIKYERKQIVLLISCTKVFLLDDKFRTITVQNVFVFPTFFLKQYIPITYVLYL